VTTPFLSLLYIVNIFIARIYIDDFRDFVYIVYGGHQIHVLKQEKVGADGIDNNIRIACANCRFSQPLPAESGQARFYKCRLYAPRPNESGTITAWPTVRSDDFCGEFVPRKEADDRIMS